MRLVVGVRGLCVGTVVTTAALAACSIQTNGTDEVTDGSASEASASDASASDDGAAPDGSISDASESEMRSGDGGVSDALADAAPDARPCVGVLCNGHCIAGGDCRSCAGASLLCGATGTCTSACPGCQDSLGTAMPIECFACDSNHQNPIGGCAYHDAGSYCLSGNYLGQYQGGPGYQCACNDAGACPGATQVCVPLGNYKSDFCLTCGETTLAPIDGHPCMGGGTCQASAAVCQ